MWQVIYVSYDLFLSCIILEHFKVYSKEYETQFYVRKVTNVNYAVGV